MNHDHDIKEKSMLKRLIDFVKRLFGKKPDATPKGGGGPGAPGKPK